MESKSLQIIVDAASPADANRLVSDLQSYLEALSEEIRTERQKPSDDTGTTLDMGATIGVVVGSAAFGYLARGIAEWLKRNQNATSGVTLPGVTMTKISSSTAEKVVLEWLRRQP